MHSFQHGERLLCLPSIPQPYGHDSFAFSGVASYLNLLRFVFVDLHRGDVKRESKAGNTGEILGGVVYRPGPENIRAMTYNEDYEDNIQFSLLYGVVDIELLPCFPGSRRMVRRYTLVFIEWFLVDPQLSV